MEHQEVGASTTSRPLVVDLDGSLIRTDLLAETALLHIRQRPPALIQIARWLTQGIPTLKHNLATATHVDVTSLPYEAKVQQLIARAREAGRPVILATASHQHLADAIAEHLDSFDDVLATHDRLNLSGHAKRDALTERYGHGGFDYVGNSIADLPILTAAHTGYLVRPSNHLLRKAEHANANTELLVPNDTAINDWLRALRLHQWAKNLLLFLPMLAAHQTDPTSALQALAAFMIFGLAASSVYLLNDLLDIPDDRHHPRKRHRPIASGRINLHQAALLTPTLLIIAFSAAWLLLPPTFLLALGAYYTATLTYSLSLKRKVMIDVLTLGLLYTLRIVAGAAALDLPLTAWMLALSLFAFLSLALIKRYAELLASPARGEDDTLTGRSYQTGDLPLLQSFGTASAYLSALVLALYIQDPTTAALYNRPAIIWLAIPIWLYWISRAWMITHRGGMHDDPVLFAVKDRASYLTGLALALVFLAAT